MLKFILLLGAAQMVLTAPPGPTGPPPRASLDDVRFLLWTRSNPGDGDYQELVMEDSSSLGLSHFNSQDPTILMIHGFNANGHGGWCITAKDELLQQGSYNVISVDWGKLTASPWYPIAVSNVPKVGCHAAKFLEWVVEEGGLDPTRLMTVGHSLGAHVAGAMSSNLTFTLPHITGLDPAGPEFHHKPPSGRLDPSDAHFVQVIHTNGGTISQGCVGLLDVSGDVDFYPNGGDHQPGCTIGGEGLTDLLGGCSHSRSHDYWVESINGMSNFTASPCRDWPTFQDGDCSSCGQGCLQMGFHVEESHRGLYYLTTNSKSPFAQGY